MTCPTKSFIFILFFLEGNHANYSENIACCSIFAEKIKKYLTMTLLADPSRKEKSEQTDSELAIVGQLLKE